MVRSPSIRAQLIALVVLVGAPAAQAAEVTEMASAFDRGDPFDMHLSVGYEHTLRRGAINRQLIGRSEAQQGVELVKELRYSEAIDTLLLRAEAGIWRDLQLHFELPIVFRNSRELQFAQNGGDPCGSPAWTYCVTPINSTLARDGFIEASAMPLAQRLVAGPDGAPGGRALPDRSGIEDLRFGLSWAPVNQQRDDTKPTWVIGFESRIAVGAVMSYDPGNPGGNTAVSDGLHKMHWWTAISRRFPYFDAWTAFHYLLPVARDDSLYKRTTFDGSGQQRGGPQHVGWIEAGVEAIPWEQPAQRNRFSIELGARLQGRFEGRGYSPIWELLAGQDNLSAPCLADPGGAVITWNNGSYCQAATQQIPYPGITRIENYLELVGTLALNIALTEHFKGRIGAALGHEQQHYITTEPAGRSICNPAQPDTCRGKLQLDDPRQVNPMYRPLIDAPGRRFQVSETTVFQFFVAATGQF